MYSEAAAEPSRYCYNPKHFPKHTNQQQKSDWNVTKSLERVIPELDRMAASIGGKCDFSTKPDGSLVVRGEEETGLQQHE